MIKITPRIHASKEIAGYEEIIKTRYKLGRGRRLQVQTVKANGKRELQIKKLYQGKELIKSTLVLFNKKGNRDSVLVNVVI